MKGKLRSGIFIQINKADSVRVCEWIDEVDWQIIVNQIEMRGASLGFDNNPGEGKSPFCRITEIPKERGRFRPNYGDFGGGFEYRFCSHPDGTKLVARSSVLEVYRKSLKPLVLILPHAIENQAPDDGNYGIIAPHDSRFLDEENYFGFYGKFFDFFHAWKWYSEDIAPFEFKFYPFSVSCTAQVLHIESNTSLDLTKDVEW